MTVTAETVTKFLRASAFDYTDQVWWTEGDDGDILLFVRCSDFFYWGTSDLEEVTDTNVDSLVETVQECEQIVGKYNAYDAFLLWCARQRNLRPQGAYYDHLDTKLHPLFDACGPVRDTDIGNPIERG